MPRRKHQSTGAYTTTGVQDFLSKDEISKIESVAVSLPAHEQTQDRLISLETVLLRRLTALADKIDTGNEPPLAANPVVTPHMSLADFNKALPSRLTALQGNLQDQINRINSLLF